MRSNHKGQRALGIVFLMFSLVMAPLAFANVACIFSEVFRDSYAQFLQDFNLTTISVPSKDDFTLAVVFGAVFLVLLFIAIRYLSYSSLRGMAKMNDVFNQKISIKVRIRFYKLFLFIGIAAAVVSGFFFNSPYFNYIVIAGGSCLGVGLLMLIPVPINFAIKRRYRGDKLIITYPRNPFLTGFDPNVLINELSAADIIGYTDLESFKANDFDKHPRIKMVLYAPEHDKSTLMMLRKEFRKEALTALKEKTYLRANHDFDIEIYEGGKHESSRDLKTRVETTTTTIYTDGSKEKHSSYKDVVTGKETTTYKLLYLHYTAYCFKVDDPNDKDHYYLVTDNGEPLEFYIYDKKKILSRRKTGYCN